VTRIKEAILLRLETEGSGAVGCFVGVQLLKLRPFRDNFIIARKKTINIEFQLIVIAVFIEKQITIFITLLDHPINYLN
jgi:uncharacterized membrane protein YsdA (DUF1294 family)